MNCPNCGSTKLQEASWFEDCPRDDKGWCQAKGGAGSSGSSGGGTAKQPTDPKKAAVRDAATYIAASRSSGYTGAAKDADEMWIGAAGSWASGSHPEELEKAAVVEWTKAHPDLAAALAPETVQGLALQEEMAAVAAKRLEKKVSTGRKVLGGIGTAAVLGGEFLGGRFSTALSNNLIKHRVLHPQRAKMVGLGTTFVAADVGSKIDRKIRGPIRQERHDKYITAVHDYDMKIARALVDGKQDEAKRLNEEKRKQTGKSGWKELGLGVGSLALHAGATYAGNVSADAASRKWWGEKAGAAKGAAGSAKDWVSQHADIGRVPKSHRIPDYFGGDTLDLKKSQYKWESERPLLHTCNLKESWFEDCPRDEGGRCLPKGASDQTGRGGKASQPKGYKRSAKTPMSNRLRDFIKAKQKDMPFLTKAVGAAAGVAGAGIAALALLPDKQQDQALNRMGKAEKAIRGGIGAVGKKLAARRTVKRAIGAYAAASEDEWLQTQARKMQATVTDEAVFRLGNRLVNKISNPRIKADIKNALNILDYDLDDEDRYNRPESYTLHGGPDGARPASSSGGGGHRPSSGGGSSSPDKAKSWQGMTNIDDIDEKVQASLRSSIAALQRNTMGGGQPTSKDLAAVTDAQIKTLFQAKAENSFEDYRSFVKANRKAPSSWEELAGQQKMDFVQDATSNVAEDPDEDIDIEDEGEDDERRTNDITTAEFNAWSDEHSDETAYGVDLDNKIAFAKTQGWRPRKPRDSSDWER